MSQQPYDGRAPESARPYYPPPQFPPPTPQGSPPQSAHGAPHYGGPQAQPHAPVSRPTPLWGLTIPAAILAFPLGLIAIYFSSQVNQRLQVGDFAGAAKNAGLARTWGIILLALGVIFTLYYIGSAG